MTVADYYQINQIIITWSSEDQVFLAKVPGCMADGRSYNEALANALVVIREWIETALELGRPILQPRGRLIAA